MKVTNKMINKEIKSFGLFFRFFIRFRRRYEFVISNKLLKLLKLKKHFKGIKVEERYIKTKNNSNLRILICSSLKKVSNSTGVLRCHGGGYALGIPELEIKTVKKIIDNTNSVVIVPDYTLSVDKPYPQGLADCYDSLLWLKSNSTNLDINPNQLFIAGSSAGGGLTIALSYLARDKKEVNIAFIMPLYPMINYKSDTYSMRDNNAPIWDYKANKLAWNLYLNGLNNLKEVPIYASPSLNKDYSNLPPTYTFIGTIDPFYDETITYINNLKNANVNAKIDIYEGCYHAFELFSSKKKIGKLANDKWISEFKYATINYFANQDNE